VIARVLEVIKLFKAARKVKRNKGACGVDGMKALELSTYIVGNRSDILKSIRKNNFLFLSI